MSYTDLYLREAAAWDRIADDVGGDRAAVSFARKAAQVYRELAEEHEAYLISREDE